MLMLVEPCWNVSLTAISVLHFFQLSTESTFSLLGGYVWSCSSSEKPLETHVYCRDITNGTNMKDNRDLHLFLFWEVNILYVHLVNILSNLNTKQFYVSQKMLMSQRKLKSLIHQPNIILWSLFYHIQHFSCCLLTCVHPHIEQRFRGMTVMRGIWIYVNRPVALSHLI